MMSLLGLFTGTWKKNDVAAQVPAALRPFRPSSPRHLS